MQYRNAEKHSQYFFRHSDFLHLHTPPAPRLEDVELERALAEPLPAVCPLKPKSPKWETFEDKTFLRRPWRAPRSFGFSFLLEGLIDVVARSPDTVRAPARRRASGVPLALRFDFDFGVEAATPHLLFESFFFGGVAFF